MRTSEEGRTSGEFMIGLFVLALAVMIGAAGGIYLAERERLRNQPPVAPAQVDTKSTKPPPGTESAPLPQGPPSPITPRQKPVPEKPAAKPAPPVPPSGSPLRYSHQSGATSIDVELGEASLVRAAQLHSPERVYFDLANARRAGSPLERLETGSTVNADDSLLAGIRVAWKEGATARLVLDLKRSCEFSYRILPQPTPRLVVDLREAK